MLRVRERDCLGSVTAGPHLLD